MDAEKQSMIDKIMKLLELGKDASGAFSAEQAAANEMASRLMAKHALSFNDLRGSKKGFSFDRQKVDPLDEIFCAWEASLAKAIAEAFDCSIVTNKSRYTPWYLNFLGTKTDLEISIFFYRHLRRTVGRKAEIGFRLKRDREIYAFGMVNTISERLQDLYKRRNAVMDTESSALMVVKVDGLQGFVKNQFPSLKKGRTRWLRGSMEAYQKGQADGSKVSLSRPVSHNGTPVHRMK